MSDQSRPHQAGLWSAPGPGVLAREGDLILLAGLADTRLLDELLELLARTASAGGDGRELADALEDALSADGAAGPPYPPIIAVGPLGQGLAVTATGLAWAEIATADGPYLLTAGQPGLLLRAALAGGVTAVHGGLSAEHRDGARTDRFSRLDRGTIRAGALAFYPGGPASPGAAGRPDPPAPPAADTELPGAVPVPEAAAPPAAPAAPAEPFEAVLLASAAAEVGRRPSLPVAGDPAPPAAPDADGAAAPMVMGAYCKNGHFDDPDARYCAVCGISMNQQTLVPRLGPRPPLGVLVLDDGSVRQLDADYVIGREPDLDAAVGDGAARGLPMADDTGTVSRVHARIELVEWRVQVTDLGSANGTRVRRPGAMTAEPLLPRVPIQLKPGSSIELGGRGLRYESHRGR